MSYSSFTILLFFFTRWRNQIVFAHKFIWDILDRSNRRRSKLSFGAPTWSFLKGGSQGIKESQDGGLIQSRASLGSVGYSYGWGITIRHKDLCSRLLTGWIIYKELKYFVRIGLRFKLSSLGSSIFNSRQVGTDGIRKYDDWTPLQLVLWQLKWV